MVFSKFKRAVTWPLALAGGLLVAGCNSSSDDATGVDTKAAQAATSSDYWLFGEVRNKGISSLLAWDPAHPDIAPSTLADNVTDLRYASASQYDSAARTRTELGVPLVYFLRNGHLMKVDLRLDRSHVPVQLSSVADACAVSDVVTLNAAADEAWVAIKRPAADGTCTSVQWVASGASASDAAVSLTHLRVLTPLHDDTGTAQTILAAGPASSGTGEWLYLLNTKLESLGMIGTPSESGISNVASAWLARDLGSSNTGYVALAGEVRRLHWLGSSASLDAGSLHHLGNQPDAAWGLPALGQNGGLFLGDGRSVYSIKTGASTLLATPSLFPISSLEETAEYLVVHGEEFFSDEELESASTPPHSALHLVAKSGATTTLLYTGSITMPAVVGTLDNAVILEGSGYLERINPATPSDSNRTSWGLQTNSSVLAVFEKTTPIGRAPYLKSVLAQPSSNPSREISEIEMISLETRSIGSLDWVSSTNPRVEWVNGFAVSGLPLSVTFSAAASDTDLVMLTPGRANSLLRVTHNLP